MERPDATLKNALNVNETRTQFAKTTQIRKATQIPKVTQIRKKH